MKTKTLFTTLAISLGLTLALLWTLGSSSFVRDVPAVRAQGPGTRYVRSDGNDSGDCTNPATPCRTVQYGADRAAAGDEILVATGTYTDPAGTVAALDKTVTLQGGWNSDFSTRGPTLYPTTLDARRMGSVISIAGQSGAPISPTIDGFTITRGDASSQAVKGGGLHSIYADPIIVNNVFTNNIANSVHYYTGDGGGLYLAQSHGVAVIQDNVFISNTAAITGGWGQGGAIYSEYSSPLIVGNVISGNFANGFFAIPDVRSIGGNGGGIVVYYGMTATTVISGNQLFNNVASAGEHGTGGGMTLGKGPMLVQNNTVHGNAACVSGYGSGGGIFLSANTGPVTITGNMVEDNTAGMGTYTSRGGGIFLEYMLAPGPVVVQDNTVVSNTASTADVGLGGGIYLRDSDGQTIIRDNRVSSNTGSTANWAIGGGLYIASSDIGAITGNLVEGNFASTAPFNASIIAAGGGIGIDYSAVLVRDNTLRDNVATPNNMGEGGGFYVRSSGGATIEENIIEGNIATLDQTGYGGGMWLERSDDATVRRNTIQDNQASNTDGYGGGAFIYRNRMTLDANTILSNTGAISTTGSGVGWGGGVAFFASIGVSCTNNIIAHNRAAGLGPAQGAGIWLRGSTIGDLATGSLLHNTVADNDGEGVWVGIYATATLANNIIAGNTVAITNTAPDSATISADHTLFWNNVNVPISGSNSISGDPAFVGGGDYHLTIGSAAIDAGVEAGVARDIDGDLRPAGDGPDVGADEISLSLVKTAPETVVFDQPITYTLILTNNNPFAVTNVIVSDVVPAGATYLSGGSYAGGVVSWTIASIAPSGSVGQVSFVVTATATVTNSQYRVVTSTEGVSTGFGPPVVTVVTTPPCRALTDVNITGPLTGTGTVALNAFTAVVTPSDATLPVTYTWQATEQTSVTHAVHATTDVVQFTWDVTGTQTVTVTTVNECGVVVSDTHVITIEAPPLCRALTDVDITGPLTGTVALYAFTTVITPSDATLPVTYTWSPEPDNGQGTASVDYRWTTSGVYTITLTAENCDGTASDTHVTTVELGKQYVYLPLVLRQFSQGGQALRSEETTGANKWQAPSRWKEPGGDGSMPLPPQKPKLRVTTQPLLPAPVPGASHAERAAQGKVLTLEPPSGTRAESLKYPALWQPK